MGLLRQNEKRIFSDHVSYIFGIYCIRGTYHVGWSSFIVLTQFCLVTIGPKSTMNSIFELGFLPHDVSSIRFFCLTSFSLLFLPLFSLDIRDKSSCKNIEEESRVLIKVFPLFPLEKYSLSLLQSSTCLSESKVCAFNIEGGQEFLRKRSFWFNKFFNFAKIDFSNMTWQFFISCLAIRMIDPLTLSFKNLFVHFCMLFWQKEKEL